MDKNDLIQLTITQDGRGASIAFDGKKIHHVEAYKLENTALPGAANLTLKLLVAFPSRESS